MSTTGRGACDRLRGEGVAGLWEAIQSCRDGVADEVQQRLVADAELRERENGPWGRFDRGGLGGLETP